MLREQKGLQQQQSNGASEDAVASLASPSSSPLPMVPAVLNVPLPSSLGQDAKDAAPPQDNNAERRARLHAIHALVRDNLNRENHFQDAPEFAELEEMCTDANGSLNEELFLSKLLWGLHRRMRLLVGLLRGNSMFSNASGPAAPGEVEGRPPRARIAGGVKRFGVEAMEFFERIRSMGVCPPPASCNMLVQLLATEGMLQEADQQFAYMLENDIQPSEACCTMLIRLRVEAGRLTDAMDILEMMEDGKYQQELYRPRFRSYQPVIRELLGRGDMDSVVKLWKHMQWRSIRPKVRNWATYTAHVWHSSKPHEEYERCTTSKICARRG